jgi:hypothetical protein
MVSEMSGDQSSSDEDDWAVEDLPLPTPKANTEKDEIANDDSYWEQQEKANVTPPEPPMADTSAPTEPEGEPMIIVDMTELSKGKIHNRNDKNSVNDPEAASTLRRKVEDGYATYAKDASLQSVGTVIPCGSSVWRMALITLREERAGHYFTPIFPPK